MGSYREGQNAASLQISAIAGNHATGLLNRLTGNGRARVWGLR